jgi:hypothetical protein
VFEIVGIAAVGFTVAHDLRRGAARSRPLLGDLGGADLVAEAEAFLGSHIRALLVELAEKDAYTEEHTRPRRAPGGAGRRRARPLARAAARPRDRRAPP